ncbi:MAG: phage tail tape measure protein, partial [Desulfurobacterium sp.]
VIGGAISGTFAFPVYEAIKYEQVMAEFNKVVGASERELTRYSTAFMKLSTEIPISRNEIARLSASLAQMDSTLKGKQLIEFTKMVTKAAFAFDMLPEEAGKAFGQIKKAFGIPTIKLLKEVGDTINYLSNTMGAEARDIIDILKRVGPVAQQFGLSARYAAVFGAAMKEAGYASEVVGTALSMSLQRLLSMNKDIMGVLGKLGITRQEFLELQKVHPEQALVRLFEGLKKLSSTERINALTKLFGAEHATKMAVFVNNIDSLKQKLAEISGKKYLGSMEQEFQALSETTTAQFQKLKNTLSNIATTIGSVFLPPLSAIASTFTYVLSPIATFINQHQTLAKIVFLPVGAFGALTLAVGGFLAVLGLLGMGIVKGIASLATLKKSLKETINVLKFGTAVQPNTMNYIVPMRQTVSYRSIFKSVFTEIKRTAVSAFEAIRTFSVSTARSLVTGFVPALRLAASVIKTATIQAIRFTFTPIGAVVTAIAFGAYLIYKNWDKVKKSFSAIWQYLYLDRIKAFFMGFKEGFSYIKQALQPIKEAFANLGRAISPLINAVGRLFGLDVKPNNNAFLTFARLGLQAAKDIAWIIGKIASGLAFFINLTASAVGLVTKYWGTLLKVFLWINPTTFPIMAFKKLYDFIKSINLFKAGKRILETLTEGIKSTLMKPVNAVKEVVRKIRNFLPFSPAKEGPLSDLHRTGLAFVKTFAEGIKGDPLIYKVNTVVGKLKSIFSSFSPTHIFSLVPKLLPFKIPDLKQILRVIPTIQAFKIPSLPRLTHTLSIIPKVLSFGLPKLNQVLNIIPNLQAFKLPKLKQEFPLVPKLLPFKFPQITGIFPQRLLPEIEFPRLPEVEYSRATIQKTEKRSVNTVYIRQIVIHTNTPISNARKLGKEIAEGIEANLPNISFSEFVEGI